MEENNESNLVQNFEQKADGQPAVPNVERNFAQEPADQLQANPKHPVLEVLGVVLLILVQVISWIYNLLISCQGDFFGCGSGYDSIYLVLIYAIADIVLLFSAFTSSGYKKALKYTGLSIIGVGILCVIIRLIRY